MAIESDIYNHTKLAMNSIIIALLTKFSFSNKSNNNNKNISSYQSIEVDNLATQFLFQYYTIINKQSLHINNEHLIEQYIKQITIAICYLLSNYINNNSESSTILLSCGTSFNVLVQAYPNIFKTIIATNEMNMEYNNTNFKSILQQIMMLAMSQQNLKQNNQLNNQNNNNTNITSIKKLDMSKYKK